MTLVVSHLDFDGNEQQAFENPAGLSWTYQIGAIGPGKIEYSLAESDPGMSRDGFAPKRTDWLLTHDGVQLMAGPMWGVNMPLSSDEIHVVGVDWLQWLDQPPLGLWDYDVTIDGVIAAGDGTLLMEIVEGTTVQDMIELILAPLHFNPSEQVVIYTSYSGTTFAQPLTGYLERTGMPTVLELLRVIAQMGAPYGFDFWFKPDKTLRMVGPRVTQAGAVTTVFTADNTNVVDGNWSNNGPAGTEILFTEGRGSTKSYWHKQYQKSIDQFRRWGLTVPVDGGDADTFQIGGLSEGDFKAQAAQQRLLFPQRELELTLKAEDFGFGNRLMQAIEVEWEKHAGSYHKIDANFWVTSQTYRPPDEDVGEDWLVDLTLDQIYSPIP